MSTRPRTSLLGATARRLTAVNSTQKVIGRTLSGLEGKGAVNALRISRFIDAFEEHLFQAGIKPPPVLVERIQRERGANLKLGVLDLGGCHVTDEICVCLARTLEQHRILRDVLLTDNPLGPVATDALVRCMVMQIGATTARGQDASSRTLHQSGPWARYETLRDMYHYRLASESRVSAVEGGEGEAKGNAVPLPRLLPVGDSSVASKSGDALALPRVPMGQGAPVTVWLLETAKLPRSRGLRRGLRRFTSSMKSGPRRPSSDELDLEHKHEMSSEMAREDHEATTQVCLQTALRDLAQITAAENKILEGKRCFAQFDTDESGGVSREEFKNGLISLGVDLAGDELDCIFDDMDKSGDGEVDEPEFLKIIASLARKKARNLRVHEDFMDMVARDESGHFTMSPLDVWPLRWNLAMLVCLGYVTIVTPFESAFLQRTMNEAADVGVLLRHDVLFWLNRVIDLLFIADIVFNFFMWSPHPNGVGWIKNGKKIRAAYLRGWFLVDFLASLPYDAIAIAVETGGGGTGAGGVVSLRLVRLLRLFKLARVLRAGRVFGRLATQVEGVSHSAMNIVRFVMQIVVVCHWMACFWMFTTAIDSDTHEYWLLREGYHRAAPSPGEQYLVCMYWALQTMSTIGYGDVMSPSTTTEYVISILSMTFGSVFWAYIIGHVCSMVNSLSKRTFIFHERMDDLNFFMNELGLPGELRARIRTYFRHHRQLMTLTINRELLRDMSPSLHGDIAQYTYRRVFVKVSWLRNAHRSFLSSVALAFQPGLFAPGEVISADYFHLITKGVAVKDTAVLCSGCMWGLDMVLTNRKLRFLTPATSLTHLYVLCLTKPQLDHLLERNPDEKRMVRRSAIWMAFRRKFLRHARNARVMSEMIVECLRGRHYTIKDLRKMFDAADEDGSGTLDLGEIKGLLVTLGLDSKSDVFIEVMHRFDHNEDSKPRGKGALSSGAKRASTTSDQFLKTIGSAVGHTNAEQHVLDDLHRSATGSWGAGGVAKSSHETQATQVDPTALAAALRKQVRELVPEICDSVRSIVQEELVRALRNSGGIAGMAAGVDAGGGPGEHRMAPCDDATAVVDTSPDGRRGQDEEGVEVSGSEYPGVVLVGSRREPGEAMEAERKGMPVRPVGRADDPGHDRPIGPLPPIVVPSLSGTVPPLSPLSVPSTPFRARNSISSEGGERQAQGAAPGS